MTKQPAKNRKSRQTQSRNSSSSDDSLYADTPSRNQPPQPPPNAPVRPIGRRSQTSSIPRTSSSFTTAAQGTTVPGVGTIVGASGPFVHVMPTDEQRGRTRVREQNARRERYPEYEGRVHRCSRCAGRRAAAYHRYSSSQHLSFLILRRFNAPVGALFAAYMMVGAYVLEDPEMAEFWSRQVYYVLFESYLSSCRLVYRKGEKGGDTKT